MFTDSDISADELFTTQYLPLAMGAQHMVLNEEQVAFSDWINNNLSKDMDVGHLLLLNVRPVVKTKVSVKVTCYRRQGQTCMRRWMMEFCSAR